MAGIGRPYGRRRNCFVKYFSFQAFADFPTRATLVGLVFLVVAVVFQPAPVLADPLTSDFPDEAGFLVIAAAGDTSISSAAFEWSARPTAGFRTLEWDQGHLVVPEGLPVEKSGPHDLGVAITGELSGSGSSGILILQDGIFNISEPIILRDGPMELHATSGELEIRGSHITYRRVADPGKEFKSGLLLLAGMALLVIVLLRRARLKASERTGD